MRRRLGLLFAAAAVASGAILGACSTPQHDHPLSPESTREVSRASTARGIVTALAAGGYAVPHPLDTTGQICPRLGCLQSIVCDTLRVTSFPTSSLATRATLPGVDARVDRFVVRFAPPMPEAQKAKYWHEIRELVAANDAAGP